MTIKTRLGLAGLLVGATALFGSLNRAYAQHEGQMLWKLSDQNAKTLEQRNLFETCEFITAVEENSNIDDANKKRQDNYQKELLRNQQAIIRNQQEILRRERGEQPRQEGNHNISNPDNLQNSAANRLTGRVFSFNYTFDRENNGLDFPIDFVGYGKKVYSVGEHFLIYVKNGAQNQKYKISRDGQYFASGNIEKIKDSSAGGFTQVRIGEQHAIPGEYVFQVYLEGSDVPFDQTDFTIKKNE